MTLWGALMIQFNVAPFLLKPLTLASGSNLNGEFPHV
jgi:hypothetical protein